MSVAATIEFLDLRQLCGYVAGASWIIMVWEGIITLDNEVAFVWRMPWTAYVKWLYFFSKYLALLFQTAVFTLQVGYVARNFVSLFHCRVYRFVEMIVSTLLMLCFDTVLLLRIYAMYGFRTWASVLATAGVLIEFVMSIASVVLTIPATLFDPGCIIVDVQKSILYFVFGTFISQAILLFLAFRRREQAQSTSSIACVTIRDGLLVFFCVAVFLVITLVWTLHNSSVTTLMIYWIPVVTCVATSRVILNLHTTRLGTVLPQFTTEIFGMHGSADSFLLSDGPFRRRGA